MKNLILSILRKKLGVKKGETYKIVYDYIKQHLIVIINDEVFEPSESIASMLNNIDKKTVSAVNDCKKPVKLILEDSLSIVELTLYYISFENKKLYKKLEL